MKKKRRVKKDVCTTGGKAQVDFEYALVNEVQKTHLQMVLFKMAIYITR